MVGAYFVPNCTLQATQSQDRWRDHTEPNCHFILFWLIILFWIPSLKTNITDQLQLKCFQNALRYRTRTCPLCLNHAGSRGYCCTFRLRYSHAHLCTHAPPPGARLSDGCRFPSRAALIRLLWNICRVPPPLQTRFHFDVAIQTPIWLLNFISGPSSGVFGCWMLLCICLGLRRTIQTFKSTLWMYQF